MVKFMIAVWSSVSVVYVGVCVVALDKVFSKHPRTCSTHTRILKTVLSPTHISNPIVSIETIHSHTHAHTHKTALSLAHDSNSLVVASTYTHTIALCLTQPEPMVIDTTYPTRTHIHYRLFSAPHTTHPQPHTYAQDRSLSLGHD